MPDVFRLQTQGECTVTNSVQDGPESFSERAFRKWMIGIATAGLLLLAFISHNVWSLCNTIHNSIAKQKRDEEIREEQKRFMERLYRNLNHD